MTLATPAALATDRDAPAGFTRLEQRTITADVVDQIKRLIASGALAPGQRLPAERVLADLLGVSRPTMREAVRALEAMGIVATRHGSGTFVTDLSAETLARPLIFVLDINRDALQELFEVRLLLEAGAADAAAAAIDEESLAALASCIDAMRAATDAESFLAPDLAFHQIVHGASGNALLHALMSGLRTLTHDSLVASASDPAARRVAADEHQQIVDALRGRDGPAAGQAMRQHVARARARAQLSGGE